MHRNNIFAGLSGAFWSLTFLLAGCAGFVANAADQDLHLAFLAVMAVYSILGMVYGLWAARNAVMRSHTGRT